MFDEKWFKGGGNSSSSYASKKKDQLDSARYNAAELKKTQDEEAAKQVQANKSGGTKALQAGGNVLKGVGNFVKDAAVGIKDSAVDTYTGIKDTVEGSVAANDNLKDTNKYIKDQKVITTKINDIVGDAVGGPKWEDPRVKELQRQMNKLALENGAGDYLTPEQKKAAGADQKKVDAWDKTHADRTKQFDEAQKVDAKKTAFASADTFLNVATLGLGTPLKAGGKALLEQGGKAVVKTLAKDVIEQGVKTGSRDVAEQLIKVTGENIAKKEAAKLAAEQLIKDGGEAVTKSIVRKTAESAGKDSLIGAGYGVTQTGKNDPNASWQDYAKNVALGATVGAAVPVIGAGAKFVKSSAPVTAADKYISSLASKTVGKVAETAPGKFVGNVVEKAQTALGETLAPVMRDFKGIVDKNSGRQVNEEVRLLDGNVSNSAAITEGRLKENPAFQELSNLLSPNDTRPGSLRRARKDAKEIGKFINEKQDAINANKLDGANPVDVPIGTPAQEKAYDLLNKSTKHDIQYAHDHDLITDANYQKYMADDNYTRVQRDMSDEIATAFKGVGGANASISKANSFTQRLKGDGGKKAVDPFVAYFDWANKVTREGERQKLSNYIIEQRQANGLGKGFLRKADDVEARQGAYAEAAQLRVLRNGLGKAVGSESKYGNRLQAELDKLNAQGLNTALKKGGQKAMNKFDVKGLGGDLPTGKPNPNRPNFIVGADGVARGDTEKAIQRLSKTVDKYKSKADELFGTAAEKDSKGMIPVRGNEEAMAAARRANNAQKEINKIIKQTGGDTQFAATEAPKLGARDTKSMIKNLVDAPVTDLEAIKRKIATREPKLAAHIDNIIQLKQSHEIASKAVKDLVDYARTKGDSAITNKTTIKTLKRGIKEVYEDDPRIVDAINKVGKVELHALLKLAQAPSKLVQRTATALNFVFTASNLVKDQVGSAVLSKDVFATHNPVTFLTGLKEAALKPSAKAILKGVGARKTAAEHFNPTAEYEQFLKYVAGSTRTDINRSLQSTAKRTYEAMGLKNDNVVRKVENINSATENLTRFQNYYGTLKKGIKQGLDGETIHKNAIQAARENSVDFSRSGDWGPILKIFNPFANANIQGSRSLIRAAAERPVSTSLKLATTIMAPVAAATYWNLSDPKRAMVYSELSDADKKNNLVFVMSDGNVLKVPMAPGIKEVGAPIRGAIEAEYGQGNPDSFLKTAKSLFVDTINPFNASDIVPQFSKPIIEAQSNHSFFTGKAIVPDYLQKKDTTDQVFKGTSQTYRDIGNRFGISPLIAKNLITGYGSSVSEQGISLFDKLRKAGGGSNADGTAIHTDNRDTASQLKGKFYESAPDPQNKANELFYGKYDPIRTKRDKLSKEVTMLVKAGKPGEAKRKADDFNQTLPGSFGGIEKYGWDKSWDDMLSSLQIKTSERSFKSRYEQ